MQAKKSLIIFFSLLCATVFSQVKDTLLLKEVLKQLKLTEKNINLEIASDRPLPYLAGKTALIIPKYKVNEEDQYGNFYFEIEPYIIIADQKTGKVLNQYRIPEEWVSDAVKLSSITIDTGLYHLNANTRAFGVRVDYSGSSNPNPYGRSDLSLFIIQNNSIKRVLKDYTISDYHGEWDTRCTGEFEEMSAVIDIDKIQSKGYNNLILKITDQMTKSTRTSDDCVEKKKTTKRIKTLKFSGTEYQ
jgi:hypothetical protein